MNNEMLYAEIRIMSDQLFFRQEDLKLCKTEEQRERLKDRWAIEDAADRIASAISHASIMSHRPRIFGIF